jgi:hypothetical protein
MPQIYDENRSRKATVVPSLVWKAIVEDEAFPDSPRARLIGDAYSAVRRHVDAEVAAQSHVCRSVMACKARFGRHPRKIHEPGEVANGAVLFDNLRGNRTRCTIRLMTATTIV